MAATTYMTWRLDCEDCGAVIDYGDGEEPDERCPDCGAEVEST